LDAELAGGEGVDVTIYDIDEDVVTDDVADGKDDGSGIECQCCFADYPFVRASLLCLFSAILTAPSCFPVQHGPVSRSSPLLFNLHLSLRVESTRRSQFLSNMYPLSNTVFSPLPLFRTKANPASHVV